MALTADQLNFLKKDLPEMMAKKMSELSKEMNEEAQGDLEFIMAIKELSKEMNEAAQGDIEFFMAIKGKVIKEIYDRCVIESK